MRANGVGTMEGGFREGVFELGDNLGEGILIAADGGRVLSGVEEKHDVHHDEGGGGGDGDLELGSF